VGVLVRRTDETAALRDAVRHWSESALLGALENNRIALYTRVLQAQYEADALAAQADEMAERIQLQRQEIDALTEKVAAMAEIQAELSRPAPEIPPQLLPRRRNTVTDRAARARRSATRRLRRAGGALLGRDGAPLG
jgi:hypothetical protein